MHKYEAPISDQYTRIIAELESFKVDFGRLYIDEIYIP